MSRYIANAAIRGANSIVSEAEKMVDEAIADLGEDKHVAFTRTAYYLPVILGFTGMEVSNLGQLRDAVAYAKKLLNAPPVDSLWLPYLGETLDAGAATLLATEAIEAVRFARGTQPEPIPGLHLTGTSSSAPASELEAVATASSANCMGDSSRWCPRNHPHCVMLAARSHVLRTHTTSRQPGKTVSSSSRHPR